MGSDSGAMFGVAPPPGGSSCAKWNHIKLVRGKPWRGWLAGPLVGVVCHHDSGTRGCRAAITGGKLSCGRNHELFPPEFKCYVPLWDEDGFRAFVVISEPAYPVAARLPHLAEVWALKTELHGAPIHVYPREWARKGPPCAVSERTPQDMRPFLVKLWKDTELREWFKSHPFPPLTPSPEPERIGEAVESDDEYDAGRERLRRLTAKGKVEAVPARLGEVLPGLAPTKNGSHKGGK